jgi:Domain of unknown function (DUF2357)/PD-(D/E)XK nuclease superfamily
VGELVENQLLPICNIPRGLLAETRNYEIKINLDGKRLPDEYVLTLNDIPVDRVFRQGSTLFSFGMGFYAGDLRIGISRGDHVLRVVDVEVDPDVAKLTRDEYAALIADIAQATLSLYRLSAVTVPAPATLHGGRSDLVALELVRTNFDAFERAASRIAMQPVRALRSTTFRTNIMRARRIDDRAIGSAIRSGLSRAASIAETVAAPRLVGALGGRWIPAITETRREESVDVYENRALLGFIRWLDGVLSDVARRLSAAAVSDIVLNARKFYAARISRWRTKLAILLRSGAFLDLSPDPTLHATSIFRTHPDYAAAFSAMSRIRSGIGTAGPAIPPLPLDKTYELYEQWCYIRFLEAVVERFPASRPRVADILKGCESPNSLGVMLASGAATEITLSSDVTLTYRRRITSKPSADGARTLLLEVIPDLTISRITPDGRCLGLVILDPKYRANASLLDALRDMHVYRDAIVDFNGVPLVKAAVALAPRPTGLPESIEALPSDRPGIRSVRPGHDPFVFQQLLQASLKALD